MVAFYQHLEPRLDIVLGGVCLKTQSVESLAFHIADRPRLGFGAVEARAPAGIEFIEHIEWIGGSEDAVRPRFSAGAGFAVHAHLPGRPMPGDGILLILRDRVVAHSGEEVVGLVVFAHMREAEPPILAFA